MLPEWLLVPAADAPGAAGAAGGVGSRACVDPPTEHGDCTSGDLLVLFVPDAGTGQRARSRLAEYRACPDPARLAVQACWCCPARPPVEIVDPGLLWLGARCGVGGDAAGGGAIAPFHAGGTLDRHQLDVALSIGRQAAERARLGRCRRFLCAGAGGSISSGVRAAALGSWAGGRWPRQKRPCHQALPPLEAGAQEEIAHESYRWLREQGGFVIAALTGAILASAQMGLQVGLMGAAAQRAAGAASSIQAGCGRWLRTIDTRGCGTVVAGKARPGAALAVMGG